MSYYDKSDKVGYDESDIEVNKELEEMLARTPPHIQRHLQHRIHDGILQRMKEDTARRCWEFIKRYETCINTVKPYNLRECCPHRDALNDCAHEVNRERNYQHYRIMYLRGELLKLHERRLAQKMETMKVRAPDSIRGWKSDYAPKYAEMMSDIGLGFGWESASEAEDEQGIHMLHALRLLSGWRPAAVQHMPDITSWMSFRDAEKLQPQHRPLSLNVREILSEDSDALQYHVVTQEWFGERVDSFLTSHYPQWSYEAIKRLVQQGHVYRYRKNGKKKFTRLTDRLEFDELLVVPTQAFWERQIAPPSGIVEEGIKFQFQLSTAVREMAHDMVLFKNEHVIVINKPKGLPVMPTNDSQEMSVSAMLPAWKFTNTAKPVVCHNLDRETSGCTVLARTKTAHRMLGRMFVKRVVPNSVYWAFCVGKPTVNFGRVRMHFDVTRGNRGDIIVARPSPTRSSKVAIAEFVVNASALEFGSFVSFYPLTTRRHQERIMAAHALRCPILGDAKYGGEAAFPSSLSLFWDPENKGLPLHLHHRKIQLPYKNTAGEFICVTAPLPPEMERTFKKLGWPCDVDDPLIPG